MDKEKDYRKILSKIFYVLIVIAFIANIGTAYQEIAGNWNKKEIMPLWN